MVFATYQIMRAKGKYWSRTSLARSKGTGFYQEFEFNVSTFGIEAEVQIVTASNLNQALTEFNNVISSYPSTAQTMM